ncbi:MAG: RNA polymerase sigma factor [Bacteroidia bacterium]
MYSEEALIKGCKKRDPEYQRAVFEKYYPVMLGLCLRYAKNQDQAKDMVQEGFIKVFDNIGKFRQASALQTWMNRIFINNALNHLKQEITYSEISEREHPVVEDDVEDVISEGLAPLSSEAVIHLMQQLPQGYRVVLNLYAIEEYSHQQIAQELGISVGTSKSQLYKARQALKALLKKQMPEREKCTS